MFLNYQCSGYIKTIFKSWFPIPIALWHTEYWKWKRKKMFFGAFVVTKIYLQIILALFQIKIASEKRIYFSAYKKRGFFICCCRSSGKSGLKQKLEEESKRLSECGFSSRLLAREGGKKLNQDNGPRVEPLQLSRRIAKGRPLLRVIAWWDYQQMKGARKDLNCGSPQRRDGTKRGTIRSRLDGRAIPGSREKRGSSSI